MLSGRSFPKSIAGDVNEPWLGLKIIDGPCQPDVRQRKRIVARKCDGSGAGPIHRQVGSETAMTQWHRGMAAVCGWVLASAMGEVGADKIRVVIGMDRVLAVVGAAVHAKAYRQVFSM